jgi:soluble lytic murein transglycosylase-like protein
MEIDKTMKILFILLLLLLPSMSSESTFHYSWQTKEITAIVEREAQKHNINSRLVYNLIDAESSGRSHIQGTPIKIKVKGKRITTRACGLMQIVSQFHYKGNRTDLFNPEVNIKVGCQVLARCIKQADGNLVVALKNYNSGYYSKYYNVPYICKILRISKKDLTKYI